MPLTLRRDQMMQTVSSLRPTCRACNWCSPSALSSAGAHTAPPQVDGNALFVLTPFPHTIYALDLTQPEPSITWRYTRRPTAWPLACNAVAPRAAA